MRLIIKKEKEKGVRVLLDDRGEGIEIRNELVYLGQGGIYPIEDPCHYVGLALDFLYIAFRK